MKRLSLAVIFAGAVALATCGNAQNLIVNGSFESGATAWTFTGGLSVLGPPSLPALGVDGTHCAGIGGADIPDSTLAQTFSVVPDSDYLVTLATAAGGDGYAGRTSIVRVDVLAPDNGVLASRSFTNISPGPLFGTNGFVKRTLTFTSPTNVSSATLRITDTSPSGGVAVDPLIDNVAVQKLPLSLAIRVSQIEVSWITVASRTYQPQYRSDLTTNLWTDFGLPIPGTGAAMSFLYTLPPGEPQRFFRVVTVP